MRLMTYVSWASGPCMSYCYMFMQEERQDSTRRLLLKQLVTCGSAQPQYLSLRLFALPLLLQTGSPRSVWPYMVRVANNNTIALLHIYISNTSQHSHIC